MITYDNVLLYEKHDVQKHEVIGNEEDKQHTVAKGVRLFRVIKPLKDDFEILTQYDAKEDKTDLEPLKDYIGYYMASVDINPYKEFVWTCVKISSITEDNEVLLLEDVRNCELKEIEILDELFPEYYVHAFV